MRLSESVPKTTPKVNPKLSDFRTREFTIACIVALGAVGLSLIPYALGYALARPGTQFTGVIMNPEDAQSYFAKMLVGYDGNWLYAIPFTTEPHSSAFVGGFYLLLGHLARWLGMSLIAMWHVSRVLADVLMFLTVFGFIAMFVRDSRQRWIAYLLAVFGSGLGWVIFLLDQPYWLGWFPVDFKMPEAHLFFGALTFPHVALGVALIVVSFRLALLAIAPTGKWAYAVGAGLANLALAIVYPFLIYLIIVTLGLYWLILSIRARRLLWREAFRLAAMFALPAPLLAYYAFTLATNPVFRAWDAQAITPSPPLPHYLMAYGIMLVLALLSLRRRQTEDTFLWVWLIAVALLVYAPLNPQRRFVEGVQVPLSILSAIGFGQVVLPWLNQTRFLRWLLSHPRYSTAGIERLLTIGLIGLMSLSNVYILASVSVTAAIQQPYPLFRSTDEIIAMTWLGRNTAYDDVVLSAYETGNYIAAHAGNRVVIGHWAETLDWESKMDEVERFYKLTTEDAWRQALLGKYRVSYIFWGNTERRLGTFNPDDAKYLQNVFANNQVRIYRVQIP